MRLFILLLLFCGLIQAQIAADSLTQATQFNEKNLLKKSPILNSPALEKRCLALALILQFEQINQCKIIRSKSINAYVLANGHVYLTSALMHNINNSHQWAAILAHENAHLALNHYAEMLQTYQKPGFFFPKAKLKKMRQKQEQQADDWSRKRLEQGGFDNQQIYYFMQRVIKISGNNKSFSHIAPAKRSQKADTVELIEQKLLADIQQLYQQ